jgi:type VI secretion system protein ImpE
MNANELYKAGNLAAAIDAQIQTVKAQPGDHGQRLFLFELAAFAGDLDRAQRQIEAVTYEDPNLDLAVVNYRKLLEAERLRRRLFTESLKPKFLLEPPDHVNLRLEAVNRLRENKPAEAAELLNKANEVAGSIKGMLNGKPFSGIRDGDDLFGTVIEGMAHGQYFWVPLEQVTALALNPPKFVRDLIWYPARLEIENESSGEIFLPALYPNSHTHADDEVKLARSTDWTGGDGSPVRGMGAKTFLVGDDGIGLLEWRELQVTG